MWYQQKTKYTHYTHIIFEHYYEYPLDNGFLFLRFLEDFGQLQLAAGQFHVK